MLQVGTSTIHLSNLNFFMHGGCNAQGIMYCENKGKKISLSNDDLVHNYYGSLGTSYRCLLVCKFTGTTYIYTLLYCGVYIYVCCSVIYQQYEQDFQSCKGGGNLKSAMSFNFRERLCIFHLYHMDPYKKLCKGYILLRIIAIHQI